MIAKLRGVVDCVSEDSVIVDVNGVGYLVFASSRTLSNLKRGIEVSLWTEMVVREDSLSLYGFSHPLEKEWFLTLTKVQGVGAKVCLNILSALSPMQLSQAIAAQDKASFTRANGVGPKLAARIVTELKGKMVGLEMGGDKEEMAAALEPTVEEKQEDNGNMRAMEDAVSALQNLGYQRIEAYEAVAKARAEKPDGDVSWLIKTALRMFVNKEL